MDSLADAPPNVDAPERLARARHLLDNIHGQIRAADEKVRVLFSGTALLAAAVAFTGTSGEALAPLGPLMVAIITLHSLILVSVAAAVVSAIIALLPRISVGQLQRSLYFFGDIAAASHEGFIGEFAAASEAELVRQALSQVYVNATIVRTKYVWIRRAALAFAAAVLFLVLKQGLMLVRA